MKFKMHSKAIKTVFKLLKYIFLGPLALIWDFISRSRVRLYQIGFLSSSKLNVPVISIGNLSVGGSGKTPFADMLLTQLEEQGLAPALLSRGYGRKVETFKIVSVNDSPLVAGDEPLWLKQRHPSATVIVGKNRIESAKHIGNCSVVILEDGFQHLAIKRDLNIALVDATQDPLDYFTIPLGRARECFSAITRAQVIILTNINLASGYNLQWAARNIRKYKTSHSILLEAKIEYAGVGKLGGGHLEGQEIRGKKVLLVSGIARPKNFECLVLESGAKIMGHLKMPDHDNSIHEDHGFKGRIKLALEMQGAEWVLITEKDAVKWAKNLCEFEFPVYVFQTKMILLDEKTKMKKSFYDLAIQSRA
jgi:tetraacyldisaccharide 4'-kinase